jgi:hypothetical protein
LAFLDGGYYRNNWQNGNASIEHRWHRHHRMHRDATCLLMAFPCFDYSRSQHALSLGYKLECDCDDLHPTAPTNDVRLGIGLETEICSAFDATLGTMRRRVKASLMWRKLV